MCSCLSLFFLFFLVLTTEINSEIRNTIHGTRIKRTQGDAEDSIRTNAIIFLGKVAAQLKPAVRDKILLPAFARGVKDPFIATRLAGLRATAACHQHFRAEEVIILYIFFVFHVR